MNAPSNVLPHDIYGLSSYPDTFLDHWKLLLICALIIIFLVCAGYFIWKKFFKKKQIQKEVVDPFILLKSQLFDLKPRNDFYEASYFFQLSFLLKQVLEVQTGVHVTDLTFKEIEAALKNESFSKNNIRVSDTLAFLKRADMIKFAHLPTDFEEAQKYHLMLCEWVKEL